MKQKLSIKDNSKNSALISSGRLEDWKIGCFRILPSLHSSIFQIFRSSLKSFFQFQKRTEIIGAFFLFIFLFSSCGKENRFDCIKRTGEKTTDTRILPPFTKIYLKDNIDVFVKQGTEQEVKIEAGNNLVSLIKTEVIDGVLHIKNENKCNWARSYKKGKISVYLTIPKLRYVSQFGSGEIKSIDTLSCDTIDILTGESGDVELYVNANVVFNHLHSTSDVTLHGKAPIQGIFHSGEGYLHCEDLQTDITWSHSVASGNEYLNAKNVLAVTIDWAGDIYYLGNPSIELKGTGKGKLIPNN